MSSDARRPLAEATAIATALLDLLRPGTSEIMIAGSIRRQKPDVGDIELVALADDRLLKLTDQLLADGVVTKADYGGVTRWGLRFRGMLYQGVKCELFIYDHNNRGFQTWLRSGPGDKNTRVMIELGKQKAPYRFKDGYCWYSRHWMKNSRDEWDADDKVLIPCPDEATVYRLLGMPFIDPPQRTEDRYMRELSKPLHLWGAKPHVCQLATGRIHDKHADMLDITVMSGKGGAGDVLTPTWDIVQYVKSGEITPEEYTELYLKLLRNRYADRPSEFHDLLKRERIVMACYCGTEVNHCHRHVAADVLRKIGLATGTLVHVMGEVEPEIVQGVLF